MSEHWMYPSPPPLADSWISEAFARDTHVLTQALSHTLTPNPPSSYFNTETPSSFSAGGGCGSGSDFETPAAPKRRNINAAGGKITKRKSRASKRNTTTFITADPANFRQMVQQVTGVKFGNGGPVPLLKPQPQRTSFNRFQGCLPTLDTSASLLHQQSPMDQSPAVPDGGQLGSFPSFPTLESWN